jgi:hypothetical protein
VLKWAKIIVRVGVGKARTAFDGFVIQGKEETRTRVKVDGKRRRCKGIASMENMVRIDNGIVRFFGTDEGKGQVEGKVIKEVSESHGKRKQDVPGDTESRSVFIRHHSRSFQIPKKSQFPSEVWIRNDPDSERLAVC